jgi:hypothetical protein
MMKQRENPQYCRDEVAAEIALCKILGIAYRVDEAGIAHISVGTESVGVVPIPEGNSIELDLEHMRQLAVDIIVFATVAFQENRVSLHGWLDKNSIRELWARSSNQRAPLSIDPESLGSVEALAKKVPPLSTFVLMLGVA